MTNSKTYFFIDINLISKQILNYGTIDEATHHGNTDDPAVHRMFISQGQYKKLLTKLEKFEAASSSD